MAVVRQRTRSPSPPAEHTGIYLPKPEQSADGFWRDLERTGSGANKELTEKGVEFYNQLLSGGKHSDSDRTCTIHTENLEESLAIGVKTSTTVESVCGVIAMFLQVDPQYITLKRKTARGAKRQAPHEEVASQVVVIGVKTFKRSAKKHSNPLLVIGGGLGGIQSMIDLDQRGQGDYICMEKHDDFGGHSWISCANKFTKLQTEKGTYHVTYSQPDQPVPQTIGETGAKYSTWPTRDQLLMMFREGARMHGLYKKAMMGTSVEMVKTKGPGEYAIQYVPVDGEGDGGIMVTSAVIAWPGNLWQANQIDFPGEDDFDGYIETCSFDKVDYGQCDKKCTIIYGHGAFTIENVRTVCEHHCKKVYVMCRKRNLCGMKMVSWMVGQSEFPIPGTIMMDGFQMMYNLVGYDCWSAFSVQTDKARSFCHVNQKTVFGVTDVYFLAGYYGLMEVVVDEIKRLTHHCAHTKKMRKLDVEVILKAIGTSPSFKVDKFLGLKELCGLWANGDCLRPISCNGMFVQARNFGSFSSGPGFAPNVKLMNWFIDYPDDWWAVYDKLPRRKADDRPAYVPDASYFLPMHMALNSSLPMLAQQSQQMDALKSRKQREAHPLEEFLPQCVAEWESYIKEFRAHGMVDDRPDPPYPFTLENTRKMMDDAWKISSGQAKHEVIEAKLFLQPGQEAPAALEDGGADGESPLPVALLFPGQGSQYVKMMEGVQDLPAVKELLEKAKPILGYDILELCVNGPEAKLEETRYCQPALFIAGLAGVEKLRGEAAESVSRASAMCGLSLGEYTALCAAGVLTFEDGLKLVKLRGEAMQDAANVGKQLMLSVAGLEEEKLSKLCKEAAAKESDSVCQIANHLFPNGFAVGGTQKAIEELKPLVENAGALQAKILKTAGAFHTPLMQPAQERLSAALEEALPNMKPPKHTIWMNASAEPMKPGADPKDIVDLLKKQLTNPVLWEPSMRGLLKEGITEFYEVGPQKQLKAMMKRIDPTAWKATKNVEI